jgi:hypothetical protein
VTRRGAERTRLHPLNEWEFSNSGFNGQKRSKMNAIAIGTMAREIWLRVGLVNGAPTGRNTIVRRQSRVQRNARPGRFHAETATLENCHLLPITYFRTSFRWARWRIAKAKNGARKAGQGT